MQQSVPILTEPGVKYFIGGVLKNCHAVKDRYYSMMFNIGLFVCLSGIVGGLLLYKYKGKLTDEELEIRTREKQEYILSKLRLVQNMKQRESQQLLTELPQWDNEFDILRRRI